MKNVVVIGERNSGKSALINRIIMGYLSKKEIMSYTPTTGVQISYKNGVYFFDIEGEITRLPLYKSFIDESDLIIVCYNSGSNGWIAGRHSIDDIDSWLDLLPPDSKKILVGTNYDSDEIGILDGENDMKASLLTWSHDMLHRRVNVLKNEGLKELEHDINNILDHSIPKKIQEDMRKNEKDDKDKEYKCCFLC
jgi:GTPase SAR1 family protein